MCDINCHGCQICFGNDPIMQQFLEDPNFGPTKEETRDWFIKMIDLGVVFEKVALKEMIEVEVPVDLINKCVFVSEKDL